MNYESRTILPHMWKLLIALLWITTLARAQQIDFQPERCKILFSVVWHDVQAGTTVPGSADDLKWLPKDAAKKYPEICYSASATDLRFVIDFNSHYTNQGTTTKTSPMTGTVTDRNYNQSTVTGTVTTTVPYSASYEYSILSLEGKVPGRIGWTDLTNFGRESHCRMGYGVCTADRDTIRPLFTDALKWVHKVRRCSAWYDPSMCPSVFVALPQ